MLWAGGGSGAAQEVALDRARWIWGEAAAERCELRRIFHLESLPARATLWITADNGYELRLNGAGVGSDAGAESEVWQSVERYDVTARLVKGRNVVGIRGVDLGGVRGVIAALRVESTNRPALEIPTDDTWRAGPEGEGADVSHPEFVEGPEWRAARVLGPNGMAPWGRVAWSEAVERSRTTSPWRRVELAPPGAGFVWPEGVAFVAEDCSVYVPLRADAWGVAFRIGDWSRAYTEFDLPCPAKIGRKLYALSWETRAAEAARHGGGGATNPPGPAPRLRLLCDAGAGALGSPSVSFDGRSLLVSMARDGEKFFHVYRVPATGGEPRRLTEGPFHDLDPVELPDGRIAFASTRIGTFEEYHQPPSRALFRMNADGTDIHPITSTLIFDNEPKVLADGRLIFVRTDNFFDRGKVETLLHGIRPDGTDGHTGFGANVGADYGVRLRAHGYGSPAPLPDGRVAYLSNRGNYVGSAGSRVADQVRLPGNLGDVAALPDGRVLCTVLRSDGKRMNSDLLGVIEPEEGPVTRVFEADLGGIHSPVFLGARRRPPVLQDHVDRAAAERPGATGYLVCQDARFTTKSKADWGRVRAIRVLGAVPLTVRSSHSHIVHVGHETVELGTVPLAADGSFHVEVPADMPLALQAVDAEGRSELNEMSWLYVRPGERRACLGCHQPRESAPAIGAGVALALQAPPLKLTGQGDPHRFRGNNPGVTGMMDLQFERFREVASLNRHALRGNPRATGRDEVRALLDQLAEGDGDRRISAAQRLAIFRVPAAAPALAVAVKDPRREVRVAAALALAACGTRASLPALLDAAEDPDRVVRGAAAVALENLTGYREEGTGTGTGTAAAWRTWFAATSWERIERDLIDRLQSGREVRGAVVALGHVGGVEGRRALREWLKVEAAKNPYPIFENDNRTDTFTFGAESVWNPRTVQEGVRALGRSGDVDALPLLEGWLARNVEPRRGNLFLAEAAIEALGRLGTPAAEEILLRTFAGLSDYWHYVGWYSDHPALYACHASPIHGRLLEALEWLGSTRAGLLVPAVIRSIPTDPDRGLFLDNDDYEVLAGRLIRRSGRGEEVTETCLALLGDPTARVAGDVKEALGRTHAAWGGHPGPENRAAQILSLVCRDPALEPRVRAAYARYLGRPEEPVRRALGNPDWTPVRHWVLFYLGRALGQLGSAGSVESLAATLGDALNEARHGRPDPATPEIHFLQLDYTPCWRAAAAWALGRIGDRRAWPALVGAVRNLENAVDVRHASARALERLAGPGDLAELQALAEGYPEVSTRRVLRAAGGRWETANPGGEPTAASHAPGPGPE